MKEIMFSCCKGCKARQLGCHAHCVRYMIYREHLRRKNEKERAETRSYYLTACSYYSVHRYTR